MSSLFTKIINKELEASFVYEDEICVGIMDVFPAHTGHMLVIPREEKARLAELPVETLGHLFQVAQKLIQAIERSSISSEAFNLFLSDGAIAGQEIPHVHLHIVPRFEGDGVKVKFGDRSPEMADRQELEAMAQEVRCQVLFLNSTRHK